MKARYLSIFAIFAALAFTSCNDFLDKNPDTRVELVNVEQLRQLLIDGYTNESYAVVGELSSDNIIDNNSPSNEGVRYNLGSYSLADDEIYAWEDVRAATDNDSPSGIWNGCYHAIAVANAVLEKGEALIADGTLSTDDRAKLDAVMAEAHLTRAYHHFLLVNIFCMPYGKTSATDQGVPYTTKPETTVNPHYERGTVAQDYEMIEKDLVAGLAKVSDLYYEQPKYHFNKQAAYAFAARFYLFKREYEKVIEYANLCFEGYDPAALMNDIWGKAGAYYYISDMGRYYTNVARPGNFLNISTYSTWWRRFVSSGRYACNREAKRATIQGPGPTWENCRWRNSKGEVFSMHPCFNGFCGSIYGDSEYGTYFAGNMCEQFEYTDKIQSIGYCHVVRSEFTAEETLLCRAEAKAFMNDFEGCVADLKIWDEAHKKGVASTSSMVEMTADVIEKFYAQDTEGYGIVKPIHIDEVCASNYPLTEANLPYVQACQHIRRIQLVHTGARWFDIKRFGLSIEHNVGLSGTRKLEVLDPRYAIQIPTEVLGAGMEPTTRTRATALGSPTAVTYKPATAGGEEN